MQGTMLYCPRDIRFEDRPEPKIRYRAMDDRRAIKTLLRP